MARGEVGKTAVGIILKRASESGRREGSGDSMVDVDAAAGRKAGCF